MYAARNGFAVLGFIGTAKRKKGKKTGGVPLAAAGGLAFFSGAAFFASVPSLAA